MGKGRRGGPVRTAACHRTERAEQQHGPVHPDVPRILVTRVPGDTYIAAWGRQAERGMRAGDDRTRRARTAGKKRSGSGSGVGAPSLPESRFTGATASDHSTLLHVAPQQLRRAREICGDRDRLLGGAGIRPICARSQGVPVRAVPAVHRHSSRCWHVRRRRPTLRGARHLVKEWLDAVTGMHNGEQRL
jgi:hypothetical protein